MIHGINGFLSKDSGKQSLSYLPSSKMTVTNKDIYIYRHCAVEGGGGSVGSYYGLE